MVVGLTGGIGSGKSTVARLFMDLGVPVYISDDRAKLLMNTSQELRLQIIELLGANSYNDNGLNRDFIASKVFNDKDLLSSLNNIVHPAVQKDFNSWQNNQMHSYVVKEAAVLFENGSYKMCDFMLLVVAPKLLRLQRVRKRDNITEEQVLERMNNQWDDARKMSLSDAVIENINLTDLEDSVLRIHKHLTIRISRGW